MLFSVVAALAALPLGFASPVEPRSAKSIVSGVTTLQQNLVTLNNTLNTFTAGSILSTFTALQIQQETNTIESSLNSLISTTKRTANLSSTATNTVAQAVVGLEPYISSTLNNIVVHKPAFATAILLIGDLSQTVEQSLITQKALSDKFSSTLIPKLAEPLQGLAPLIVAQIDSYFTSAIAAYQNCTGLICLPPIPSS